MKKSLLIIMLLLNFSFEIKGNECPWNITKLPLPQEMGKFKNECEYLLTLEILKITAQLEMDSYYKFATKETKPRIKNFTHYLDIKSEPGGLASIFGQDFKHIDIIDVSYEELLTSIDKELLNGDEVLNKIQEKIKEIHLPKNRYDLITISHALYYIAREEWMRIVKKAYESLNENGILIITLCDGGEKTNFLKFFGGISLDFEEFIDACEIKFNKTNVESFIYPGGVLADEFSILLHVVGFYLWRIDQSASLYDVIDYIINNVHREGGILKMTCNQYFLIIKK